MRNLSIVFLTILAFACRGVPEGQGQIVLARIEYVYKLKPAIASDIWPGMEESQYDVPLIYYTDNSCFIANPTKRFLDNYHSVLVFQNSGLKIYKASERIDSIPFHMATGFTMGDSAAYDNYAPFM